MKTRLTIALLFLIAVVIVAPSSFASCLKCSLYQDCYSTVYNGAAGCYSSGNSCMVSGTCTGFGADPNCTTNCPKIPKVQQESSARPLNMDYQIVEVKIERSNVMTARSAAVQMTAPADFGRN